MASPLAPASPYRKGALERINARYERYLSDGFPTADIEGRPERLQCRNEIDRTNWLGLLLKCQAAAAQGQGADPIDPSLRCTSNRMYALSHDDTQARLWALFGQVAAAQANWWRLKDAVRDAETLAELNGLDLDEGWP